MIRALLCAMGLHQWMPYEYFGQMRRRCGVCEFRQYFNPEREQPMYGWQDLE